MRKSVIRFSSATLFEYRTVSIANGRTAQRTNHGAIEAVILAVF